MSDIIKISQKKTGLNMPNREQVVFRRTFGLELWLVQYCFGKKMENIKILKKNKLFKAILL